MLLRKLKGEHKKFSAESRKTQYRPNTTHLRQAGALHQKLFPHGQEQRQQLEKEATNQSMNKKLAWGLAEEDADR